MSQPIPYTRQFDFTDFQSSNPLLPPPGTALDAEFNAIIVTAVKILSNLALIQRDDGRLVNQSVTLETLSPAVMVALGAGAVWLPRGAWVTGTIYAISDVVSVATGSYVCAVAHTAGADFPTDRTAGKWIKLFDDAGSAPADGSVTAAKLAAAAVTAAAIGFTALDLAGSIRGGGGISAGTAPVGALLHAKKATGDVFAKVERATKAQGNVGYQVIGVGVTWQIAAAANVDELGVGVAGSVATMTFRSAGGVDNAGHFRVTAAAAPTTGAGLSAYFATGIGYLDGYDHTASAWRVVKLRGQEVYLAAAGVDVVKVTATGIDVTGTVQRGGVDLGYLDLPQNAQSGAYTLVLADRGKHIYSANAGSQTIGIPNNSDVAFPVGSAIAIVNNGSGPIAITAPGAGTLKLAGAGSTGNRMLAANGLATVLKIGIDAWFVTGSGLT